MVSEVDRKLTSIKMLFCKKLVYRRAISAMLFIDKAMKKIISTSYYQKHFYTVSFQLYECMRK